MTFTLPNLPYAYDALDSFIDAQTMEIHHSKHHQAYVDKLNAAVKDSEHADKSLEDLMANIATLSPAIRNNGGGHYNHSFFWQILAKDGGELDGSLKDDIVSTFGSVEEFQNEFEQAGANRFGSGWAWLILSDGKLVVCSTPNQDNPIMDIAEVKGTPILGLDVWEHAYYLRYQNKRPDYLKAFWTAVNWSQVSALYQAAKS